MGSNWKQGCQNQWWHDLWREGLVSGNGRVGANVYGGVKDETVMLTHHKLWHNGQTNELPDVSAAFEDYRLEHTECEIKYEEERIRLTMKEGEVVTIFHQNPSGCA